MGIKKYITIFALLLSALNNIYGTSPTKSKSWEKTMGSYDYRQTKSYPKDMLFAEDFYDAALKGKLQSTKKKPFLFSSLQWIGKKPGGSTQGGIYKDLNGDIWFVKKAQFPIKEYLGSKVMDLLIGPMVPEVRIPMDAPGYTASKLLPGFLTKGEFERSENLKHKLIDGEEELLIAMNLIGQADQNLGNLGYINMRDRVEAARIDFDDAFDYHLIIQKLPLYKNLRSISLDL